MCGIVGLFSVSGAPVPERDIERMNQAQRHRGPDGSGVWVEGPVGLGHTRLSILDTSVGGAQPMAFADGRYRITFNGEIYNFVELREELRQHGWSFATESDTEVILSAYAQWGADCQRRFNGMWAFAIWDRRESRLFLSRDRFGVKPLHYVPGPDFVAFASEMKAFLPLAWFDLSFDEAMVALSIRQQSRLEGTEACILRGVRRLPAGHHLILAPGCAPRVERWWNTLDHLQEVPPDLGVQARGLRELLFDACALRLRSDVPIGTALSGGLDSSTVHAVLAQAARKGTGTRQTADWQRAFIAEFPGTVQDERDYAEAVVRHVGTVADIKRIDPGEAARHSDEIIFHLEDIQGNCSAVWLLYREYRRAGVKVSIDGHGGDELFLGYHHHLPTAIEAASDPETRAAYRRIQDGMSSDALRDAYVPLMDPAELLRIPSADVPYAGRAEDQDRLAARDRLFRHSFADFHNHTLPTILRNFDRLSMAHGVEVRAPFLDWRLVSYAFSLPQTSKLGGGFTKRVLREAVRGLIPEPVRLRTSKLGFVCPIHSWVEGAFAEYIHDAVHAQGFREASVWDGRALSGLVEESLRQDRTRILYVAWPFIHAARIADLFREAAVNWRRGG